MSRITLPTSILIEDSATAHEERSKLDGAIDSASDFLVRNIISSRDPNTINYSLATKGFLLYYKPADDIPTLLDFLRSASLAILVLNKLVLTGLALDAAIAKMGPGKTLLSEEILAKAARIEAIREATFIEELETNALVVRSYHEPDNSSDMAGDVSSYSPSVFFD